MTTSAGSNGLFSVLLRIRPVTSFISWAETWLPPKSSRNVHKIPDNHFIFILCPLLYDINECHTQVHGEKLVPAGVGPDSLVDEVIVVVVVEMILFLMEIHHSETA